MSEGGNRWFEQPQPALRAPAKPADTEVPAANPAKDLWIRCAGCDEILYKPKLAEQLLVCAHCNHHYRLGAFDRLAMLADEGSVVRHDVELAPVDALDFVDSKPYTGRIAASQAKVGEKDAFLSASCTLDGLPVELGIFNFRFMGGSMGSVVGEAITRLYERAAANGNPAIVVSASGGARMQEGILSLMQMAKTCAALDRMRREAGTPYISVLTDPTTGGVAASFAMLGDVILAEPKALIGFAGPRVVEQTIGESLPEGFQTSEYLLDHGMLDAIVHRGELRATISRTLSLLLGQGLPALAALPAKA